MRPSARIHFQRSWRIPSPWVLSGETGCSKKQIPASFTLRRIGFATGTASKRASVRAALDEELQMAAGRPVWWRESERGPEVPESLGLGRVGVSLSYAQSEAWLAVGWEGQIGLDAVSIGSIPDWEEVASVYLEPPARERLYESARPDLDFCREWAGFEARLKLGGFPLREGVTPPPALLIEATFHNVAVAVALNLDAHAGIAGVAPPGVAHNAPGVSRLDGYSDGA
jgi:hypothetical protein